MSPKSTRYTSYAREAGTLRTGKMAPRIGGDLHHLPLEGFRMGERERTTTVRESPKRSGGKKKECLSLGGNSHAFGSPKNTFPREKKTLIRVV